MTEVETLQARIDLLEELFGNLCLMLSSSTFPEEYLGLLQAAAATASDIMNPVVWNEQAGLPPQSTPGCCCDRCKILRGEYGTGNSAVH